MTAITEAEARTRPCPFADVTSGNRHIDGEPRRECLCVASDCMAWQIHPSLDVSRQQIGVCGLLRPTPPDLELLRRAVTYTHPCGFGVIEKWRTVGMLFGVDEAVARRLCNRFGVDPDKLVAR